MRQTPTPSPATNGPRPLLVLAVFLAAAFATGALGSWATFASVRTWYPLLQKPSWNPPAWVFGPVWTTLYVLMAVAAWRAWRQASELAAARQIVAGYGAQLTANALWSLIFFGLRSPRCALADILVLLALLLWMQRLMAKTDRTAALLWLPYVLWVGFATALNAAIVWLN